MTRRLCVSLSAILLTLAVPAAAGSGQALSDPELAATRGGLMTPNGYEIGFGAMVRTYVDGQLVLATQLTWTDKGAQVTPVAGGASSASPGSFTATIPGATGGATQVFHDLTDGRIASVVLNSANGRTVRQDTDITLVIPRLADLQKQAAGDRTAASLQSALGVAMRNR